MEALLHIGTEKTGSTSVQNFLYANRAALLEQQDTLFPSTLGDRTNRALPFMASAPDHIDEFVRHQGLLDQASRDQAKADYAHAFAQELAQTPAKRCVILSEHLHSRLRTHEDRLRLHEILNRHFSKITIVVYIRRQIDFALSLYSTGIKAGMVAPGVAAPTEYPCDYRQLVQQWGDVFGQENIVLRLFDRAELVAGSTVDDFCHVAGLNPAGLPRPDSANISLDRLGLELLRRINRDLPRFRDNRPNKLRADIKQYFETHFCDGPKLEPTAAQIADFEAYFADSNDWVRERFFPERETLFAPRRIPEDPAPMLPQAELDRIAGFLTDIWISKQKKIHHLRSRLP